MSTYANKFEQAGIEEREKLTRLYSTLGITDYGFTPIKGYAKVDSFYRDEDGVKYIVEAKVRKNYINDYATHMIQRDKYDELVTYYRKGCTPLYINFFRDGVVIYNLTERIEADSLEWVTLDCNKTTVVDAGKTAKLVSNILYDKAKGDKKGKNK